MPSRSTLPTAKADNQLTDRDEKKEMLLMKITREIPANQLSTAELISKIKSERLDKQASYSRFVQYRNLKPEIGASEFYSIFDSVAANPYMETIELDFSATHLDVLLNKYVQITPANGCNKMIWEFGMTGSEPGSLLSDRYQPLNS